MGKKIMYNLLKRPTHPPMIIMNLIHLKFLRINIFNRQIKKCSVTVNVEKEKNWICILSFVKMILHVLRVPFCISQIIRLVHI